MHTKFTCFRILCALALVGMVFTACVPKKVRYGGIVRGVVYADLNGSGTIEAGEDPLAGADVHLSGCGPDFTQTTGMDGSFNFTNLPEGSCHVSVSKGGWNFTGSYPSLGYPVPVASDPDLPTAFSIFMGPVMDFIPTDTTLPESPTDTSTPVPPPTVPPTPVSSSPMLTPRGKDVNCRYAPGTEYSSIGALMAGNVVPIHGTNGSRTWWQIQNPLDIAGHYCWVADSVVSTSGDTSLVPVVAIPVPFVTNVGVVVNPGAVVHGTCGGPNPVSFQVSITTNGPASVVYRVEIYNGDGSFRNSPGDQTLSFASASTQSFDPGGVYKTDCGSFYILALVTSPNSISARADWSVVSP